jgi:hypothetical protein
MIASLAVVLPTGTVTLAGTVTSGPLAASRTTIPVGAARSNVTTQETPDPPVTMALERVTPTKVGGPGNWAIECVISAPDKIETTIAAKMSALLVASQCDLLFIGSPSF